MIKDIIRRLRVLLVSYISHNKPFFSCPSSVLIVAPHPDDEVLGCGGLIVRLVAEGKIPHIVFMTGGEQSHGCCCNISKEEIIAARHSLASNAMRILGVPESNIHYLSYPDGNIDRNNEETRRLSDLTHDLIPESVFVPHWGEGWSDHVKTGSIVKELLPEKVPVYEYCVWLWYYNVWGLDWKNARRLKMTAEEHLLKLRAINQYVTPLAPCGKPWSGVLPRILLKANQSKTELYFKVR